MTNDEDQPAFQEGAAARAARYAKGSNPYRGTGSPDCRLWNRGWTAQFKKERDNA